MHSSLGRVEMRLGRCILPRLYDLELWVDLGPECGFKGRLDAYIDVREASSVVTLNAADLAIANVSLLWNNEVLPATSIVEDKEEEQLLLQFKDGMVLPAGNAAVLRIEYSGFLNEKLDGFYRSCYNVDGVTRNMAVGIFEPADARRFLPCWDEPDFKASFRFKVHAPSDQVILSNMPAVSESVTGGLKTVEFKESILMSTYILTVVIGDLEYMEAMSEDGVTLRVYTRRGYLHKAKFGMDIALRLLPFYTEFFQLSYPLPKLDIVCVPTMKAGALENFGCIVFLEDAFFVDEDSSPAHQQEVALDTAHEVAHMWFGNIVTLEWWTHLWLNEGMATWISYYAVHYLFPDWDVWMSLSGVKSSGQRLDRLKKSHPVEVPVGHVNEANNAFDAISYFKGASVIHMLQSYLGPTDLKRGLAAYIQKFAFGNANSDNLWDSIEDATGNKAVKEIMHSWTKQKGYPVVKVSLLENSTVQFEQYHFLANGEEGEGKWIIPVSIKFEATESFLLLRDKPLQLHVENPASWILVNAGQAGFYHVEYDHTLWQLLKGAVAGFSNPLDRLGVLQDFHALSQAMRKPPQELIKLLKAYNNETHPIVLSTLVDVVVNVSRVFILAAPEKASTARDLFAKLLETPARNIGWQAKKGENHLVSTLRQKLFNALVELEHKEICLEATALFENRHSAPVPADVMEAVYRNAMNTSENFNVLLEMYKTSENPEERRHIICTIAWSYNPAITKKALDMSLSPEVIPQDMQYVFSGARVDGNPHVWSWLKLNWEGVFEKLGEGYLLNRVMNAVTEHMWSLKQANEFEEFMLDCCSKMRSTKVLQECHERVCLRSNWLRHTAAHWDELCSSLGA